MARHHSSIDMTLPSLTLSEHCAEERSNMRTRPTWSICWAKPLRWRILS